MCLPYAGGSTTTYLPWAKLLPPSIELALGTLDRAATGAASRRAAVGGVGAPRYGTEHTLSLQTSAGGVQSSSVPQALGPHT